MSDATIIRRRANRLASLALECRDFSEAFSTIFARTRMPQVELHDPQESHRFDQLRKRVVEALEDIYGGQSQRCQDMAKHFPILDACAVTGSRNVVRSTIPEALVKRGADLARYADELNDEAALIEREEDHRGTPGFRKHGP